jgi:hypothetical protein
MKALPPPPIQLELLPSRPHALARFEVEPSVRNEILRALAEILLDAANAETADETR